MGQAANRCRRRRGPSADRERRGADGRSHARRRAAGRPHRNDGPRHGHGLGPRRGPAAEPPLRPVPGRDEALPGRARPPRAMDAKSLGQGGGRRAKGAGAVRFATALGACRRRTGPRLGGRPRCPRLDLAERTVGRPARRLGLRPQPRQEPFDPARHRCRRPPRMSARAADPRSGRHVRRSMRRRQSAVNGCRAGRSKRAQRLSAVKPMMRLVGVAAAVEKSLLGGGAGGRQPTRQSVQARRTTRDASPKVGRRIGISAAS